MDKVDRFMATAQKLDQISARPVPARRPDGRRRAAAGRLARAIYRLLSTLLLGLALAIILFGIITGLGYAIAQLAPTIRLDNVVDAFSVGLAFSGILSVAFIGLMILGAIASEWLNRHWY